MICYLVTLFQARPYVCGTCGDTFAFIQQVQQHVMTHSRAGPLLMATPDRQGPIIITPSQESIPTGTFKITSQEAGHVGVMATTKFLSPSAFIDKVSCGW